MLQQDSHNKLNTHLVYNRNLSRRSFIHRTRFSQTKQDYTKLLKNVGWGIAGLLAFYGAVHFGVLALSTGYCWLGLSCIKCSVTSHAASAGIVLWSGLGTAIFSHAAAFCFQHLERT